jgi:hypothetical protein
MDKCYICHQNEGTLRKTCKNEKCTAKTHSCCLEKQYITLKNCGICKSDIIIRKTFNCKKLKNFLFIIFSFILYSYLIFTLVMGLNPLNPFDLNFNDIKLIGKHDIYGMNYIIFFAFSLINVPFYLSPFLSIFKEDKLLIELNDKYGQFGIILMLSIFEIIYILICHCIGYNLIKRFLIEQCIFYTYKTFFIGVAFSFCMPLVVLLLFITYKYLLPLLVEPFCDEQFGD